MRISQEKQNKISEQILAFLFENNTKMVFTSEVAKEIARDEEFTKKLLKGLLKTNLVHEIKKNKEGISYLKRSRWRLSDSAYNFYKNHALNAQNSF